MKHNRDSKKDYWDEAVMFTASDNSLDSTEISYLENHFSNLAKNMNSYVVKNRNEPKLGNISEERYS